MDKLTFWKKEDSLPVNNAPDTFRFDEPGDERESLGPHMDMHNPFLDDERHDEIMPSRNEPSFDGNKPFKVQSVQQSNVPPQMGGYDMNMTNKNIEVISAKLDALKSELESMNQRLISIESLARRESSPQSAASMPNYKRYQQW